MPPKSATGAKKKPAKKALALKEAAVKEATAKSSAQKAALGKRTTRDKEKHAAVTANRALTPAAEDHQDRSPAPPASNLLQPPGDALTEASGLFVDDVLLTDQSNDEDSEGALEGDAVEAADYIEYETDNFWNGEDDAVEGDADPREGIVSDWDLLAEEFTVEAEELGTFRHSLLHTS
jgi:hypothetical protein